MVDVVVVGGIDVVEVVVGTVGSGALGSDCSIEIVLKLPSGLGEQVDVPGPPPIQLKLWGVSDPPKSRAA